MLSLRIAADIVDDIELASTLNNLNVEARSITTSRGAWMSGLNIASASRVQFTSTCLGGPQ